MFRKLILATSFGLCVAPALADDGVAEAAGRCLNQSNASYETTVYQAFRYDMMFQQRQFNLTLGIRQAFTSKTFPLPGQELLPSDPDAPKAPWDCCPQILSLPPQNGVLGGQIVQ